MIIIRHSRFGNYSVGSCHYFLEPVEEDHEKP
jgi:hypothetical protein